MEEMNGIKTLTEKLLSRDLLSPFLKGYEARESQGIMSEEVARIMEKGGISLIEGGTGVGKTLAYLIPSALFALDRGTRTIISTSTKSLQDQIIFKDLPLVKELFKNQGLFLTASTLKGRNNYLCLHRLRGAVEMGKVSEEAVNWAHTTQWGDLEEAPQPGLATLLGSRWEYCLGKNCPYREACFYQKAWKRAEDSHVVVVNHHLLLSHLLREKKGLPYFERLIVDEAHRLERTALEVLGENCSLNRMLRRAQGISGLGLSLEGGQPFIKGLQGLERHLNHALTFLASILPQGRVTQEALPEKGEVERLLRQLSYTMEEVALKGEGLVRRLGEDAPLMGEIALASRELLSSAQVLEHWATEEEEMVKWVETRFRDPLVVSFHLVPLDVSSSLNDTLFSVVDGVVLTSATISVGGSMEHIRRTLGIKKARELFLPPEFSYSHQVRLVVKGGLPNPGSKDYKEKILEAISSILLERGGQTLILFTAYRLMEGVVKALRRAFPHLRFYVQGEEGRDTLVNKFREDPQGVLAGVESFWEGIDLPGDSLRTLIIVKLPFRSPEEPLVAARSRWFQGQGRDPFWDYLLPEAVLVFRQGFGRLIRSKEDTGVVYILDSRILEKSYGRVFLSSLPQVNVEME